MKKLSFLQERIKVTFNPDKRGFDLSFVCKENFQHFSMYYKYFVGLKDFGPLWNACCRISDSFCHGHARLKIYGYTERQAFVYLCNNFNITF